MSKADLRVDWATHEAAKYAVENWHYSRCLPSGKLVKIGAWENSAFIGVVIFSRGTNQHIGKPFGLDQTCVVELTRVALSAHSAPVSRVLSLAVKFLRSQSEGVRLIISFADSRHGHVGTIYQAGNWVYTGTGTADNRCQAFKKNGKIYQWRSVCAELGKLGKKRTVGDAERSGYIPLGYMPKHRYLMPLDDEMRARIAPLAKPYPKRPKQAMAGDHPEQRRCDTDPDAPNCAC